MEYEYQSQYQTSTRTSTSTTVPSALRRTLRVVTGGRLVASYFVDQQESDRTKGQEVELHRLSLLLMQSITCPSSGWRVEKGADGWSTDIALRLAAVLVLPASPGRSARRARPWAVLSSIWTWGLGACQILHSARERSPRLPAR